MVESNHVLAAFTFISMCLCLIPLPWHLEAWNTGTCLEIFWLSLGLLFQFVNLVVWDKNAINWAPVFCDISTQLQNALAVAIPACSLCISRRLYIIASVRTVTVTRSERLRAILVDFGIAFGIPVLSLPLAFVSQGHRFNILEGYGCTPALYVSPVVFPTVYLVPFLVSCASFVYSVLAVRAFYKCQSQFRELLSKNNNLSCNRYFRLIALASLDMLFTIPMEVYFVYSNTRYGLDPWISWADTHSNFGAVRQITRSSYSRLPGFIFDMNLSRWLVVACGFVFFGFFGFAEEARKNYRLAFQTVSKRFGLSTGSMGTLFSSTGGSSKDVKISSFADSGLGSVPRLEKNGKQSSFASFDAQMSLGDVGGFLSKEDFSPTATSSGSSTAAPSLPPSVDDSYTFSGSRADLSAPGLEDGRDATEPQRSRSPAGSVDMV